MEIVVGIALFVQSVWDIRTKELPLRISIFLGICGLGYSIYMRRDLWEIIFALIPGVLCLVMGYITKQAIGYGDGILLCALGMWYSSEVLIVMFMMALICAAVVGLALLVIFQKSGKYELLMEAKDSGQTVKMYTVGNDVTVNSFVMIAKDGGETTFICIDGNMARSDLEKLLAEQMK